jgi:hypothetical protein
VVTVTLVRGGAPEQVFTKCSRGLRPGLECNSRAWMTDWNDHPRSFGWIRTAGEILERDGAAHHIPEASLNLRWHVLRVRCYRAAAAWVLRCRPPDLESNT